MSTRLYTHPSLGPLRARRSPSLSTLQFRNIPYASIPARWQDPVLRSGPLAASAEDPFDATRHGPPCPQFPGGQGLDVMLTGQVELKRVDDEEEAEAAPTGEADEFGCANLVVTVPEGVEGREEGVPVMVWVHGGALVIGANSWPQYDLARLVSRSAKIGKPVIGVAINYRHNVYGFLASEKIGSKGNFGLKDAICAFQWIKQNIAGFGGDPDQVLAFGESAGSFFLHHLLYADVPSPLFNRVVLQSGDLSLRRPADAPYQEAIFAKVMKYLGLDADKPDDVQAFKEMGAAEVTAKLPSPQELHGYCAYVDGELLKNGKLPRMESLGEDRRVLAEGCWCEDVTIGDMAMDGSIMSGSLLTDPNAGSHVVTALESVLSVEETARLSNAYKLSASPAEQIQGIMQLLSHLRFYTPCLVLHDAFKKYGGGKRIQRYHMHQPNPFPGFCTGIPSHELDVAYVLQNYAPLMPPEHKELANNITDMWIAQAYGDHWSDDKGGAVFVVKPDCTSAMMGEDEYDEVMREERGKMMMELEWEKIIKLGMALANTTGNG
ncbi:Alpha/Beta hydrolase protein [Lineolata rhizophorae]|uniref:Alpha/Beta hydrolase protein n=1 Tax=Lineolata rhizophorae TaxID=578093 RepID=A0A6A6NS81_9PEZI|nr:Alpha/Beta hydrolase protein [Lineolata rhizophorae]